MNDMPVDIEPARNALKVEGIRSLLTLLPLGLAAGAGVRGLTGMAEFANRNVNPPPNVMARQSVIRIPYPIQPEEEEKKPRGLLSMRKQADEPFMQDAAKAVGSGLGITRELPAGSPMPQPGVPLPNRGLFGHIKGDQATSLANSPFFVAGAPMMAGGAFAGGYKAVDWLLNKLKHRELDSEVNEAEKDYNRALAGDHGKIASDRSDPYEKLPELYERLEKLGGSQITPWNSIPGGATGAYMLAAGLLSGGTFGATYNWAKSQNPKKQFDEAVRRRQQEMMTRSPRPLIARLDPYIAKAAGNAGTNQEYDTDVTARSDTSKTASISA